MKTFLVTVAVSAAMLASAFAGEVEGTVKEIDLTAMTITLSDDSVVKVGADVSLEGIQAGDAVKITTDDNNVATKVNLAG